LETAARHIPDEELHAYLDQALSRSQCVEIECHLAECRRCQAERNAVAAIRDRTTALLADAVPARIQIPSFEQLVAQHQVRRTLRRRMIERVRRNGLMAAGLVAAVGLGWLTRGLVAPSAPAATPTIAANPEPAAPSSKSRPASDAPPPSNRVLVAVGPVTATGDQALALDLVPTEPIQTASRRLPAVRREDRGEPVLQVNAIAADEPFALDGLWQGVDLAQALEQTAGNVPRIDGLPILDIQLQRGLGDQRPIVVVAQQHPSGRILRTIEGPIERVEELLEKQATRMAVPLQASWPATTPPDYLGDGAGSARRGLRMLTVTGALPVDSLNAMARSIEIRR
jgi:hypothetical protein